MKRIFTSFFSAALFLIGCAPKETLHFKNAEINEGMIYRKDADQPFTGIVNGFPAKSLMNGHLQTLVIGKTVQQYSRRLENLLEAACSFEVEDGVIHGDAKCTEPDTNVHLTITTPGGKLTGQVLGYASEGDSSPYYQFSFKNGLYDGVNFVKDPETGAILHESKWDKGQKVLTQAPPQPPATHESCPDQWLNAFRAEVGSEPIVTHAMLQEWEQRCKERQRPH